jgi:hypothetical protein
VAPSLDLPRSVIYLRSFDDERFTSMPAGGDNAFWPFQVKTEEERLVAALQSMGEVLAIGRPGEKLPELGARRFYFKDDEWQSVICDWIKRCRLVVARIAGTDALWWELRTVFALSKGRRLILAVPDDRSTYAAFRERFGAEVAAAGPLPVIDRLADLRRASHAGYIFFDAGRTAHFVRFRGSSERALRRALEPVAGRLNTF